MTAATLVAQTPEPIAAALAGPSRRTVVLPLPSVRGTLVAGGMTALLGLIWTAPATLGADARIAFSVFAIAVVLWVFSDCNDAFVALAGGVALALSGVQSSDELFASLGDPTIWLLLAAFVIAAAAAATGLSQRLAAAACARAGSVSGLFHRLTAVLIATAFVVPSTSGRAALMVPVFAALAGAIGDRRVVRALALLFPTIILLSAIASLIGAGAHLVMVELLDQLGAGQLTFARWLVLGLPFALVSCFASCTVILRLFLTRDERRRPLALGAPGAGSLGASPSERPAGSRGRLSRAERCVLIVVGTLLAAWLSEPLHGVDSTLVAVVGALAVTAPVVGAVPFKQAVKGVDWTLIVFLAATLQLGHALIESGGARWLMDALLALVGDVAGRSPLAVVAAVAVVSLLAHLVINSRTARATVLVPMVVLLALSFGLDPTALAFVSTAAAGFCLTLPVSAKPVLMFSGLERETFAPRDLLRLSGVLGPVHLVLLLAFAFVVWPALGMPITGDARPVAAHAQLTPDAAPAADRSAERERAAAQRLAAQRGAALARSRREVEQLRRQLAERPRALAAGSPPAARSGARSEPIVLTAGYTAQPAPAPASAPSRPGLPGSRR